VTISEPAKEALAFPVEKEVPAHLVPLSFERHLSDAGFLLTPDEPKKQASVIEPPKLEKELSDPCFLIEGTAKKTVEESAPVRRTAPVINLEEFETFKAAPALDEWDDSAILDQWTREEDEPPVFEKVRSVSSESGSSALSDSKTAWRPRARKPIVEKPKSVVAPQPRRRQVRQIVTVNNSTPTRRPAPPSQTKAPPAWARVGTVKRRRKPRRTVEERFQVGSFHKTKCFVKITVKKDPLHFGKPERNKRDPNEVWTLRRGVTVEIGEVQGKSAYIRAVVTFWSKYQDRATEQPREKEVEGWISLKDAKGWTLM